MNSNGILRTHWIHVSFHFLLDIFLLFAAFSGALLIRFGDEATGSISHHWPFILISGAAFSSAIYIGGFYSTHSSTKGLFHRSLVLFFLAIGASLILVAVTYGTFVVPIGRGVVLIGAMTTYIVALLHHAYLLHVLRSRTERVAYIVTNAFDEAETRLFDAFGGSKLQLVGIVTGLGYQPKGELRILGDVADLPEIISRERIERVLCTNENLSDRQLIKHFCKLRYSGVSVMPLVLLCEEIEQYVPLELVSHEWFLNASGEPQLLYIKKIKRLLDILISCIGLVLGLPIILLGAVAVKLSSPGPAFYRQTRLGRFGRSFRMTKLRTMRTDAEVDGIQWSRKDDPRVFTVGKFLRKYRIDEIPQLWHVLCGDMSFVGPRPERPEIIADLAKEIPFYEERLMIQPGITGWAQVSYPYGSNVYDARRKLEYDLYYMKHMSVFLDVFILLDTVRTVLCVGAKPSNTRSATESDVILEWQRLQATEESRTEKMEFGAV